MVSHFSLTRNMNQKFAFKSLVLTAMLWIGLGTSATFAQSGADRFFKQIYAQQPASWYPISDENSGNYEESYSNGLKTRQSFLLVDAYAVGKERYLKQLETEGLNEFLPGAQFFQGELSANLEYNDGKLPFLGFFDENGVGMVFPGSYDVIGDAFLALLGRAELKKQGQQAGFAEEIAKLLATLRLKQKDCNEEILEYGKAQTKWNGTTLNLRMSYDLKCKVDASNEWGPKTKYVQFDFEFKESKLHAITPLEWP
jgi:hypothetical protein